MLSNQYSKNPGEELRISDGLQTADPLALFPSEGATTQPTTFQAARKTNAGNDSAPLLAFTSEEALSRDAARARRRAHEFFLSKRSHAVRVSVMFVWSLLLRAVHHYAPLLKTSTVGVSRHTWHLVVRATHGCFVITLRLGAAARSRVTALRSTLRDAITRLREGGDAFSAADALKIVNAELVSLWRAFCFRTAVTANRFQRKRVSVVTERAASPALLRLRRGVGQLHTWTYPVALFVSGVAVGVSLVTFARTPAYESVPAVTSVVSANHTPVPVLTNQAAVSSSSAGDLGQTPRGWSASPAAATERPVSIGQKPRGASASPAAPAERPVSTGTVGSRGRPSALPASRVAGADTSAGRQRRFQGSLNITSRPGGAAVFINGQRVGTTPLVLQNLPIGSRAVRLTLAGYEPWSTAVQVVAQQRTTLTAALQASGSR